MSDVELPRVYLNSAGVVCSLGAGIDNVAANLFGPVPDEGFLSHSQRFSTDRNLPLGQVKVALPSLTIPREQTRNNQLLSAALEPLMPAINALKSRYNPSRIGIVIGSSTSGIAEGEAGLAHRLRHGAFPQDFHYTMQELSAPSRFLARLLGINGPAWTVSTACTSGGKALASAARLLRQGVCDAVIAGGVDTLCGMTVEGFSSLSATSDTISNPFSRNRNGINIGEGAGIFIVSREEAPVRLAGYGETSDAYHISAPHPEGVGAESAMREALDSAGIASEQVDYVNLHGTGTVQNDKMEGNTIHRVFGSDIACSSTKPLTGHTLAAAGAIEAIFCWLALQRTDGKLPPHVWDGEIDPEIEPMYGMGRSHNSKRTHYAMSNSFAFGGNNISLLLAGE